MKIRWKHSAAPDLCSEYNGGCHQNAICNQTELVVNCTCRTGYQGDGYICEPINRWERPVVFSNLNSCSTSFCRLDVNVQMFTPGDVTSSTVFCLYSRCVEEQNGGCSDFASCKFTGPVSESHFCHCLNMRLISLCCSKVFFTAHVTLQSHHSVVKFVITYQESNGQKCSELKLD